MTRVQFSDTDAQGVVYYGRYMPYFDVAKTEYHRLLGQFMRGGDRNQFVMRSVNTNYHAPARFDDLLEVFIRTRRIGRTSVTQALAAYRARGDVEYAEPNSLAAATLAADGIATVASSSSRAARCRTSSGRCANSASTRAPTARAGMERRRVQDVVRCTGTSEGESGRTGPGRRDPDLPSE